jgi:hypothetical protein
VSSRLSQVFLNFVHVQCKFFQAAFKALDKSEKVVGDAKAILPRIHFLKVQAGFLNVSVYSTSAVFISSLTNSSLNSLAIIWSLSTVFRTVVNFCDQGLGYII